MDQEKSCEESSAQANNEQQECQQPTTESQNLSDVTAEQNTTGVNTALSTLVDVPPTGATSGDVITTTDDVITADTTSSDGAATTSPPDAATSDDVSATIDDVTAADTAGGEQRANNISSGSNGMRPSRINITPEEMQLAELKVRVICQEKNNAALRMELKCAELQVAAKEKLDSKKTRLIELLDTKLADIEKKNRRLIDMMEQLVRDKEAHTKRLVDATKNMEELTRKLCESEKARRELRAANNELKEMLGNMEGKGTKLAALAKEKVLKYKEENERIQRELDDMKGGGEGAEQSGDDPATAEDGPWSVCFDRLTVLHQQIVDHVTPTEQPAAAAAEEATEETSAVMSATPEKLRELLVAAAAELSPSLEQLRQAVVDTVNTATSRIIVLERKNVELTRQKQNEQQQTLTSAGAGTGNGSSTSAETGSEETGSGKPGTASDEQLAAKDREISALKDELQKLKSAIGHLAGLGLTAAS